MTAEGSAAAEIAALPVHCESPTGAQLPLVAIIVLNWNAADVTTECLRSIELLEYPRVVTLVVDNGSRDGSGQVLATRHPTVTVICSQSNRGFAGGCNLGIEVALAKGAEYILLLNNDATAAPNSLDLLVAELEDDARAAVASPKIYVAGQHHRIYYAAGTFSWWQGRSHAYHGEHESRTPAGVRAVTFVSGCVMLLRSEALKRVGLFDERFFAYAEDADICARLLQAGFRALYVPAAHAWHRDGYTAKRLMGMPVAVRLAVRNKLLLMAKHARPWHWATFLPCFSVHSVLFYVLRGVWARDLRSSWAAIVGLRDGVLLALRERALPLRR